MSDSPRTHSGLYVGPTGRTGNYDTLDIPDHVLGGRRIKRLVSIKLFTHTGYGVNGFSEVRKTATDVQVLFNGSRSVSYTSLHAGEALLDKTANSRIYFGAALTADIAVWFQYISDDQQKKAVV